MPEQWSVESRTSACRRLERRHLAILTSQRASMRLVIAVIQLWEWQSSQSRPDCQNGTLVSCRARFVIYGVARTGRCRLPCCRLLGSFHNACQVHENQSQAVTVTGKGEEGQPVAYLFHCQNSSILEDFPCRDRCESILKYRRHPLYEVATLSKSRERPADASIIVMFTRWLR